MLLSSLNVKKSYSNKLHCMKHMVSVQLICTILQLQQRNVWTGHFSIQMRLTITLASNFNKKIMSTTFQRDPNTIESQSIDYQMYSMCVCFTINSDWSTACDTAAYQCLESINLCNIPKLLFSSMNTRLMNSKNIIVKILIQIIALLSASIIGVLSARDQNSNLEISS